MIYMNILIDENTIRLILRVNTAITLRVVRVSYEHRRRHDLTKSLVYFRQSHRQKSAKSQAGIS